jgi:hypothetical protein
MNQFFTNLRNAFRSTRPTHKPANRLRTGFETLEERLVLSSPPAAPALVANDISSSQINLTWNQVANDSGYYVEGSVNGGSWQLLTTVNSNYGACNIPGMTSNTMYDFRVGAYNSAGTSWSPVRQAATVLHPSTPGLPPIDGAVTYSPVSGALFGPKGPTFLDVEQGQAGDCWMLSGLAEVAARQPQLISSMFTNLGTEVENGATVGLYQVRLYSANGTPQYFIVDSELPTSANIATAFGTVYDQPVGGSGAVNGSSAPVLWVALAEKAFAEQLGNSYGNLNSGDPSNGLHTIVDHAAPYSTPVNAGSIAYAWSHNEFVILNSKSNPTSANIVSGHGYAVVGYNSSTGLFTLFNPWGTTSSGYTPMPNTNGQPAYGWFTAPAAFLTQNFTGQNIGVEATPSIAVAARGVDSQVDMAGPIAVGADFSQAGQSVEHAMPATNAATHTAGTPTQAYALPELVKPQDQSVNFWSDFSKASVTADFLGGAWMEV